MRFIVSQMIAFILGVMVAIAIMRQINPNLIQGEDKPHKRDPQSGNQPQPHLEHGGPQGGKPQQPKKEGPKKHPH